MTNNTNNNSFLVYGYIVKKRRSNVCVKNQPRKSLCTSTHNASQHQEMVNLCS